MSWVEELGVATPQYPQASKERVGAERRNTWLVWKHRETSWG